ncbi:MAG TPA: D-aminoacyl-tRNA deacylase [Opitutaceae bacterium]|nr:D-aminoacyl-tRNA deacylase [Opitutaceae bacterium]
MRAVVQRVASASVTIDGELCGKIGPGLLVLLGIAEDDTEADGAWLAKKIAALRIFPDASPEGDAPDRMNRSVTDIGGGVLVISQFTLFASTRKGTRPSFHRAARPEIAIPLYETFLRQIETELGRPPASGRFGAMMQVALVNDGPVTLLLDSKTRE